MLAFGNVFHFCQMTLCDVKRKRHFVCWHIITPYNSRNQRYIYFMQSDANNIQIPCNMYNVKVAYVLHICIIISYPQLLKRG